MPRLKGSIESGSSLNIDEILRRAKNVWNSLRLLRRTKERDTKDFSTTPTATLEMTQQIKLRRFFATLRIACGCCVGQKENSVSHITHPIISTEVRYAHVVERSRRSRTNTQSTIIPNSELLVHPAAARLDFSTAPTAPLEMMGVFVVDHILIKYGKAVPLFPSSRPSKRE